MEAYINRFGLRKHVEAIGSRTDLPTIAACLKVLEATDAHETAYKQRGHNLQDSLLVATIAAKEAALLDMQNLPAYRTEQEARARAEAAKVNGDSYEEQRQRRIASEAMYFQANGLIIAKKIFHVKKAEERMLGTGFVVGGRNETATIRSLTQINGIPIPELERKMRDGNDPDDPEDVAAYQEVFGQLFPDSRSFGQRILSSYECIFLGPQESLIEILATDNDIVLGLGLTHMQLADFLDNFVFRTNMTKKEFEGKTYGVVTVNNRAYRLSESREPGSLGSPFEDGLTGNVNKFVTRIDDSARIQFGAMQPELVRRYGFYEGRRTPFRLDPKNLAMFAGLTS